MAKICPVTNDKVLYLDCLECDDKICLKPDKAEYDHSDVSDDRMTKNNIRNTGTIKKGK